MQVKTNMVANTIFMPQMYPAKLQVPTNKSGEFYEFTVDRDMTLEGFQNHILENTDGSIKSLQFVAKDQEADPAQLTVGEMTRSKFQMKVDTSTFEVYPDLRSMTGSGKHYLDATKYKKELDKLLQME